MGIIKNGMVLLNVPALSEGLVIGALIIISVLADIIRARRDEMKRDIWDTIIGNRVFFCLCFLLSYLFYCLLLFPVF